VESILSFLLTSYLLKFGDPFKIPGFTPDDSRTLDTFHHYEYGPVLYLGKKKFVSLKEFKKK